MIRDITSKMKSTTFSIIFVIVVYFFTTKKLFDKIFVTSRIVVDEEFHIPMGSVYCKQDFSMWDPKVTTLPGMYLFSTLLLAPFGLCSTYWLRATSLFSSCLNILLFYFLFSKYESHNKFHNIASALTLALLPPLYFFAHFYYTDVMSLSFLLLMFVFSENSHHYLASLFGMCAIITRQNNVIWLIMVAGRYFILETYACIMGQYHPSIPRIFELSNLPKYTKTMVTQPAGVFKKLNLDFWLDMAGYAAVLFSFVYFTLSNGGIVVGDRLAHTAVLNLPQLFYFSIFCMVFAWPHFLCELIEFIEFGTKYIDWMSWLVAVAMMIIRYNTLVHPYLLADNRHYVFYIWNRFYERFFWFRYVMVPVYIFGWYVIVKVMCNKRDISLFLTYLPATILTVATQKLLDLRYFFVPFVLFRLRIRNTHTTVFNLILEFVTFAVMNCITFNLFFNKTIEWSEFSAPQRLIW